MKVLILMQYHYQAGMKLLNTDIQLVCEKGLNSGNALFKGLTMHNDMLGLVFYIQWPKYYSLCKEKNGRLLQLVRRACPELEDGLKCREGILWI